MAKTVAHVVGARPNFIKAAPVIRALRARNVPQVLVHTGQHYDQAMSEIFFRELDLPRPDVNLGVGSGSHASQTAAIMVELEGAFLSAEPSLVVLYGDVNSTVAGALVAAKLLVPVAHVEAGLRSFDPTMPEEINRRVTDALSRLLFVTSPEGIGNLGREGIDLAGIHFVGNPMIDTLLASLDRLDSGEVRERLGIARSDAYAVATLHRPANVDTPQAATTLVGVLDGLSELLPVVLPLHPRGRPSLEEAGLRSTERLHIVEPLGYLEFISLLRDATLVMTDSGGIQEETTMLQVPCLTVRANTERPITISHGTNRLVLPEEVVPAARRILDGSWVASSEAPPLWDGHAGERIATVIARWLEQRAA